MAEHDLRKSQQSDFGGKKGEGVIIWELHPPLVFFLYIHFLFCIGCSSDLF